MAVIWSRSEENEWAPRDLPGEGLSLLSIIEPGPSGNAKAGTPALKPNSAQRRSWVLLAPEQADVTVNGETVATGIRALRDRDVVEFNNSGPMYFSTERLARVTPCPETERAIYCQRCKTKIEPGSPAVECPRCSAWYHQTDTLPCWRYSEQCTLCPQSTDFDAGYSWHPEDL